MIKNLDPVKCGMGQGVDCCAFLTMAPTGFECGRETGLMTLLVEKVRKGEMSARRTPAANYPECQTF